MTGAVATVATAATAHALHPLLRGCGMFDFSLAVGGLDSYGREEVLRAVARRAGIEISDDVDLVFYFPWMNATGCSVPRFIPTSLYIDWLCSVIWTGGASS